VCKGNIGGNCKDSKSNKFVIGKQFTYKSYYLLMVMAVSLFLKLFIEHLSKDLSE